MVKIETFVVIAIEKKIAYKIENNDNQNDAKPKIKQNFFSDSDKKRE